MSGDESCTGSPNHSTPESEPTPAPQLSKCRSLRPVVPAPLTIAPTASPAPLQDANPSPQAVVGCGPTSRSHVLPPLPKPGRKPATDIPTDKRQEQNRRAQRDFRARKAKKVDELQEQLENAVQRHQKEVAEKDAKLRHLEEQVSGLKNVNQELLQERDRWQQEASYLGQISGILLREGEETSPDQVTGVITGLLQRIAPTQIAGVLSSLQRLAPSTVPDPDVFMPAVPLKRMTPRRVASFVKNIQPSTPWNDPEAMEIDFTALYSSKRADNRPSINFMTQTGTDGDFGSCGFCTDEQNCACKNPLSLRADDTMPPSAPKPALAKLSGPGSCADCQANPRQRAWCQRVAQLRNESNPALSNGGRTPPLTPPLSSRFDTPEREAGRDSVGCSEAFKLLDGRVPMDSEAMDWVGTLKPIEPPTSTSMDSDRRYSAMELDAASIIVTLQQSMAPLVPRQSDGENAELVKIAQRQRQQHGHIHSPSPSSLSQTPEWINNPYQRESSGTLKRKRTYSGSPVLQISNIINGESPGKGYGLGIDSQAARKLWA
ncbi:hypothetical protein GQ43DRAFT_441082 [Delitschia confertaspora ATCC 74209]|uniref:Hap4 transcription factor heteromerisation domain-containing protein n=1 Tax=Delitschia confertaspora ATCC 74209 TaxID=1513339 RepID=A0A9P4JQU1_9PLEO|nr:hypothetical protein GQ43DRAFT_441082 [Delitschia confertaspora ATCC 74209]